MIRLFRIAFVPVVWLLLAKGMVLGQTQIPAQETAPASSPVSISSTILKAQAPTVSASSPATVWVTPTLDCGAASTRPPSRVAHTLKNNPSTASVLHRKPLMAIFAAQVDTLSGYIVDEAERVLILDMPNLREQGKMFSRIVVFLEKGNTPKTRILTTGELQEWMKDSHTSIEQLTAGNNMHVADLVRFFNTAHQQGEPLTHNERRLLDLLQNWNVLREVDSQWVLVEPDRFLVTIPQSSMVRGCKQCLVTAAQRCTILEHEMSHAKFALDNDYREHTLRFWFKTMSLDVREKFVSFLTSRGYDPNNHELMIDEMQAFLMHTPDTAMFSASELGVTHADLEDLRQAFNKSAALAAEDRMP